MNNPNFILFTGFLGSGKTSLLLKCARYLSERGKRCAIIVNEVGEIGIDNLQMKKMGYDVWEIFGGCICCTLAVNLEQTIKNLMEDFELDVILLEPSGAADPAAIFPSLERGGFPKEKCQNVFILDPTRIDMFEAVMLPYLEAAIPLSDRAVINKIDVAAPDEIKRSENLISHYNPDISVLKINVNALNNSHIEMLLN